MHPRGAGLPHPRSRLRPLMLAWVIGLLGVLGQLLLGACTPHPPDPEDDPPAVTMPAGSLGERSEQVRPPLALTATDGTQLRLLSVRAKASVEQPLAFTELHLVFQNAEDRTIEGRFRIDLPPRAAISRFAMKIGDHWQEGEVVERQAARVAYEDFLHRRRDPALLEHEAGNSFSARVFPIEARSTKEIVVSYSHELASSSEPYRLALRGLPELAEFSARIIRRENVGPILRTEMYEANWVPTADLELRADAGVLGPIALRHANLAVARWAPPGDDVGESFHELTVLFDTSASRAIGFDTRIHRLADLVRALVVRQGRDFSLRVIAFDQTTSQIYTGPASGFGHDALESIAAGRALGASDLVDALSQLAGSTAHGDRIVVVTDGILTAGNTEVADLTKVASDLAANGVERIDVIVDDGSLGDPGMRALTTASPAATGIVVGAGLAAETIADKLSRTTLPSLSLTVPGAAWVWACRPATK